MLKHHSETSKKPERVAILGAAGFIGKSLQRALEAENVPTLALTRADIDLTEMHSSEKLSSYLKATDALVFLATVTPDRGKGIDAFMKNVRIAENVCKALQKTPVAQVIYLSSDTVYSLNRGLISEQSPTDPEDLYGVMHLARETMLKTEVKAPLACLRSTLIYGIEDTHNSYGPNRMRRVGRKEGKITLFGNGEECRDHIHIEDLSSLILRALFHKSSGVLNLATGRSISYMDLAKKIAALFDTPVDVVGTPRNNPITHRHFDVSNIYKAFPAFCFRQIEEGLKEVHLEEFALTKRI